MLNQTKKVLEFLKSDRDSISLESIDLALSEIKNIEKISVKVPVSECDIESIFKPVVYNDETATWSFTSDSGQQVSVNFLRG